MNSTDRIEIRIGGVAQERDAVAARGQLAGQLRGVDGGPTAAVSFLRQQVDAHGAPRAGREPRFGRRQGGHDVHVLVRIVYRSVPVSVKQCQLRTAHHEHVRQLENFQR